MIPLDKLVVCGKKFNLTEAVHRHMLIHSGEKKFQCSYCPKAFVCSKVKLQHYKNDLCMLFKIPKMGIIFVLNFILINLFLNSIKI